jgi:hypothetical protein
MPETTERPARDLTVRFRVTQDELDYLKQIALEEERTVSGVLRVALRQFMEQREDGNQ